MRKSLLELLGFAFALALSTAAPAVGMGGINVGSSLGQPLRADIELTAVTKAEKASLAARLASPDAYKEAGLDYPFGNKFKFQVESRANDEPYLKVSSELPVTDPFVIMLVELTWSAGKLVREYTFLLDPPGYIPDRPAPAEVQAVAPAIQVAPAVPPVTPGGQVAPLEQPPEVVVAPLGESTETRGRESQPVEQPEVLPPEELPELDEFLPPEKLSELDEFIVVKRGDTMREVADRYRLSDMSLDRMLVALYRANADRFDGRNMNRIKAGKVLRLPHQREVEAVSQSDAVKEIRAQTADWNLYRQKLASAATHRRQAQLAQQVATGKISSSVADKAPVAKETAREVLRLSKGETPGDGATASTGGKVASAQDRRDAEQEESIARSKALKEEQDRIAMLEKQKQELRRLEQLKSGLPEVKSQAAALAESAKPATPASGVSEAPASPAAAADAPKPPKPAPKPAPKVAEPEPLMDQIMSGLDVVVAEPLYLAAGALVLFGLGGLGFVRARQKKKSFHEALGEHTEAGAAAVGAYLAEPVVPSPDTGDFTRMGEASQAVLETEHIDPIGEADLFLNFGRDAQAEEILKEALQKTPNDHRIQLKLLGIYSNRGDTTSFSAIARQLQHSGDSEAWQQALAMGRKLEPNNPMYGGSGSVEDTGSATALFAPSKPAAEAAAPELDFDIDLGSLAAKGASSPGQGGAGQSYVMSFDVTATEQAPAMDFNVAIEQTPAMDLEVGAAPGEGASAQAALPDTGEMIFDVGSFGAVPPAEPEPAEPARAEGLMEFTLDFPVEKSAEAPAPEAPMAGMGLAGISLNLDDEGALQSEPGGKDERWQEVATKLDLAKAYQEMGDASGAREILEEVLREGDAEQREAAQTLLNQLD